ncbi:DNA phosphorothioation-associated DGQHR protein 1 [Rubrivivax albus]|uniref:DGQHR domain-containing protein n=1 Tax=Rubrivivax albus TaxID=2499835 RepID=A0A3S2TMH7_9BURK|nr:DNA phosphorothioation-associated DGQHR protein 1 [Rubrivivax albus]RVT51322.1 DGQHR domain-containing protein [Rubrivivax albus]
MATTFPHSVPALRVRQPMGEYFVVVLPAELLLRVAYSDRLSARISADGQSYELEGTQRLLQPKRLNAIADYINRSDAAFPNTIILAANIRPEDGLSEGEDPDDDRAQANASRRWTIQEGDKGHVLTIPTGDKLAAVIDGQHRLFAFAEAREQRYEMELICSVFLDLPKPYQAQLFATINSTQKPVDKSLTYELFGYNIDEEPEDHWSPDKLAVFLTRRLHVDEELMSPLRGRISIAPIKDQPLEKLQESAEWRVSTAVVVEGIMRLITTNPKKDTSDLLDGSRKPRSALRGLRKDRSPLRDVYLDNQDKILYTIVINYLKACEKLFWASAAKDSFITRTVGFQALFDVLRRHLAKSSYDSKNISVTYFGDALEPASKLNFADDIYRSASGAGRTAIRKAIEGAMGVTA